MSDEGYITKESEECALVLHPSNDQLTRSLTPSLPNHNHYRNPNHNLNLDSNANPNPDLNLNPNSNPSPR